jgi:hypothetical protein
LWTEGEAKSGGSKLFETDERGTEYHEWTKDGDDIKDVWATHNNHYHTYKVIGKGANYHYTDSTERHEHDETEITTRVGHCDNSSWN